MSIRLEMLQVARLAPKLLGESTQLVSWFLRQQQNSDGGFKDRTGRSDLYYTVFGIDGLLALQAELPGDQIGHYLDRFGNGEGLDFVHLCCLARCHGALTNHYHKGGGPSVAPNLAARIESFRSDDGGYNPRQRSSSGTAYGAFLALDALQNLGCSIIEPLRLVQSLKLLETSDGAWTNSREGQSAVGSTNATAAASTILRHLQMPVNASVADWLWARRHVQGGFLAAPSAPMPDLLSTATTLHALSGMQRDLTPLKESCLDFIDTLWTSDGGFHGNWSDDVVDCEYTFYGLLSLGHLSL